MTPAAGQLRPPRVLGTLLGVVTGPDTAVGEGDLTVLDRLASGASLVGL